MRKKLIIGGIVLFIGIGYLLYTMVSGSLTYYSTGSAFMDKNPIVYDEAVRISGRVVDGSIDWNAEKIQLRFSIADSKAKMPVVYDGSKPEDFRDGKDITIEGKYASDGVFYASHILMKCPSKYVPGK